MSPIALELPASRAPARPAIAESAHDRHAPAPGTPAVALSLRKNLAWTLAGNLIYAGCQWGMFAVLAKLGSSEMLGRFALAQAVTAPALLVAGCMRGLQATDTRRQFSFADYMGLRALVLALGIMAIAVVAWRAHWSAEMLCVLAALSCVRLFDSLSDGVYGLLQQNEKMDRIAVSRIILGVVQLIALAAVIRWTHSLILASVALAVMSVLVTVTYDVSSASMMLGAIHHGADERVDGRWVRFEARRLLPLFWLALPLALVNLLIALNNNIPRYLLERFAGLRELGIFAAMSALMAAGMIIVTALGHSSLPRLAKEFNTHHRKGFVVLLAKLIGIVAALALIGILGALAAGRPVLTLLYTPEYAAHQRSLVWLMAACGAAGIGSIFGYAMTAARLIRIQLPLFFLVTLATYAGGRMRIPGHAVQGAAEAVASGALVQIIGSAAILAYVLSRTETRQAGAGTATSAHSDLSFVETLRCDWSRNQHNHKGRFIVTLFRIAHACGDLKERRPWLWRACWPVLSLYVIGVEWVLGVELQFRARVGPGLALFHGQGLVVSGNCVIGANCVLRQGVTIGGRPRPGNRTAADGHGDCPVLGDRVEVGVNAIILGNVRIGDGAIIGAGAVVIKDVPPRSVVAGNPARVLRFLDEPSKPDKTETKL